MPALPNVPSVLKYQVHWQVEGDALATTIHYFKYSGGPPTSANLSSMAAAAVSSAQTRFAGLMRTVSGMNDAMITDLTGSSFAQGSGGTPWLGTESEPNVPPGAAALVNHQIARRYRGGKPRTYLPVGTASDITNVGFWSSAFVAEVTTAWGDWVADILASGSGCTLTQIVNVSYYHGFTVVTSPTTGRARNVPTLRATPQVDNITGHNVPEVIASQRRRNRDA